MSLKENNIWGIIKGFMPPPLFWVLLVSIIGGVIMWVAGFTPFIVGMFLTFVVFYLCVSLYIMCRQGYWFITKKGDYSKDVKKNEK